MFHPAELPHRIGVLLHAADELHEGRVGLDALHGAWRSQLACVSVPTSHVHTWRQLPSGSTSGTLALTVEAQLMYVHSAVACPAHACVRRAGSVAVSVLITQLPCVTCPLDTQAFSLQAPPASIRTCSWAS